MNVNIGESYTQENISSKMMNLLALKFPKKLQKMPDNSELAEKDANALGLENLDNRIEIFKNNFYSRSVHNLLEEHVSNIDALNKLLINAFNTIVVTEMVENNQELLINFSEVIKTNTINFNRASTGSFNLLDRASFKLFFGDEVSINILAKLIEEKLKDIKTFSKKFSETSKKESILTNEKLPASSNPFASKEKKYNIMSYYQESMNKHTQDQQDNLNSLLDLLKSRIKLNNIFLPGFIKYISQQHCQITL
jgi:hypothetical protein